MIQHPNIIEKSINPVTHFIKDLKKLLLTKNPQISKLLRQEQLWKHTGQDLEE